MKISPVGANCVEEIVKKAKKRKGVRSMESKEGLFSGKMRFFSSFLYLPCVVPLFLRSVCEREREGKGKREREREKRSNGTVDLAMGRVKLRIPRPEDWLRRQLWDM